MNIPEVTIIGSDDVGLKATDGDIVYYLTPCCKAGVKGMEFGVGCRACYELVDPALGMGWFRDGDFSFLR
jgi:hypothetical protein